VPRLAGVLWRRNSKGQKGVPAERPPLPHRPGATQTRMCGRSGSSAGAPATTCPQHHLAGGGTMNCLRLRHAGHAGHEAVLNMKAIEKLEGGAVNLLQAPRKAGLARAPQAVQKKQDTWGQGLWTQCKPREEPTAGPAQGRALARARRRQCRWNTWLQGSFLLRPAGAISSRQMMQMPSQRARSSALASCAAREKRVARRPALRNRISRVADC